MRHSIKFRVYKSRQLNFVRRNFLAWENLTRADRMFKRMSTHQAFRSWRDLYLDIKNTKMCSRVIFEKSIQSGRLTVPSVNLFFQQVSEKNGGARIASPT